MKPFDIEKAKSGKPIVTRDGRDARFIAHIPEPGDLYRIVAFIEHGQSAMSFREDGSFRTGEQTRHDLFMAKQKKTVYVNVYGSRLNTIRNHGNQSATFDTEEGALDNAKNNGVELIAVAIPIEIEV